MEDKSQITNLLFLGLIENTFIISLVNESNFNLLEKMYMIIIIIMQITCRSHVDHMQITCRSHTMAVRSHVNHINRHMQVTCTYQIKITKSHAEYRYSTIFLSTFTWMIFLLNNSINQNLNIVPNVYTCMYVRMYVRMYVCMYVCVYVCMYVCMSFLCT